MGLKGSQILVVEDSLDLLDVITMLLRVEGAEVAGTRSGHEALAVFRTRPFDVVVACVIAYLEGLCVASAA